MTSDSYDPRTILRGSYAKDIATIGLEVQRISRGLLADPKVSRDGRTVAFIAGLMIDFGSTGGDVFTVPIDGGEPMNLTPGMAASATSLAWRCDGRLLAKLLTGDRTEFADLGSGIREDNQQIL